MRLPGFSSVTGEENPYLYNGKELEDEFGLNWYHYGARYYDPQLGRWLTLSINKLLSSAIPSVSV